MNPLVRTGRSAGLLLAAGATMFGMAWLGLEFGRQGGSIASIWLANAAMIAWLVRTPRRRWKALVPVIFLGNLLAGLSIGDAPGTAAALAACHLFEIVLVSWLFSRSFAPTDPFHSLGQIGRLASLALAGPLCSTLLVGAFLTLAGLPAGTGSLLHWLAANSLGILVLTPLLLTWSGPRRGTAAAAPVEYLLLLGLGAVTAFWLFSQAISALFLLTPLLVFAGLRLRLDQAAALVLTVCGIGLFLTLSGQGPFSAAALDPSTSIFLLKVFMATVATLVLPITALNQERARTAEALRSSEEHYRLLADHSSDLVLRLDGEGRASFVSSAARRLLGMPEQALAGEALASVIHPDDRVRLPEALERAQRGGTAVTCFRMRTASGDHRWIEAHFRLAAPHDQRSEAASGAGLPSCAAMVEGRCSTGADAPCSNAPQPLGTAVGTTALTIVATLRDVHQRRIAELDAARSASRLRESNRLLLMAENLASLGHWTHDPAVGEILLSAEAALLLDMPQLTISPHDLVALVHPDNRHALLRSVVRARRREAPTECVVRTLRQRGERTLQVRLQQREVASGSLALFGVVSDITAKLRAKQQFRHY